MGFLCSLRLAIPSAALSLTFCPLREANRAPRVRDCACIPCPGQAGSPQEDTNTREEAWTQFLPQIPACTFPAPNCKVWPLLASCTPLQMKACLKDLPLETLQPILSKGFRVEIRALCSVTMGKSVSSSEHCLRNGNNKLNQGWASLLGSEVSQEVLQLQSRLWGLPCTLFHLLGGGVQHLRFAEVETETPREERTCPWSHGW